MKRCLIIDSMHESIVPLLNGIGFEAEYVPEISRDEIIRVISKYDGLVLRSKTKVDEELLKGAGKVKFIARAGAGLDQIDEDYVIGRGIKILNSPEGNRDAVGEHTLGMLLALFNKMNSGDAEVRKGQWRREANRGHEVKGKTIGILGYGNMGTAFAQRLKGFECDVIAFDKYKDTAPDGYVKIVDQDEFFLKTDILSIHIPLSKENDHLINDEYINSFKKSIYVLNTARGSVLDLTALCQSMEENKVLGAALDVLENEKLDKLSEEESRNFDFLTSSKRTILTPHIAGWSFESYEKINKVLCDKIAALSI